MLILTFLDSKEYLGDSLSCNCEERMDGLLKFLCWGEIKFLGTQAASGSTPPAADYDGKTEGQRERCLVPLCPQIPHGLH
jgi:hypothetical protein